MKQTLPEILAPAGSYDIMVQAYQAGADAVYLGGTAFSARAYASNLSDTELIQAIEYAALHNKKLYLTVNTLLKDKEIDRLSVFLKEPYAAGLHGVIVQDLGVVKVIRELFPDLPIHASTQMTITTSAAALALKELGITRVVPARELSLPEIQELKEQSGLEVEVFVHGALCYCYSGQCLLSSMIGGRSGNRGRCAQPCRQGYQILDSRAQKPSNELFYLSPKDLCGLSSVPALMELGVDSFKIEGRMKKAEYVISAVLAYRKAVDLYAELQDRAQNMTQTYDKDYAENHYDNPGNNSDMGRNDGIYKKEILHKVTPPHCVRRQVGRRNKIACGDGGSLREWLHRFSLKNEKERLADIYNRGSFTEGYFSQKHGVDMMSMDRNHHNGVRIGTVKKVSGGTLTIQLEKELYAGDVIEVRTTQGESVELTSGTNGAACKEVTINGKQLKKIRIGDLVYRTKNRQLCELLLTENETRKLKENVHISVMLRKDLPVTIKMDCDGADVCVTGQKVIKAENRPVTREVLEEKLYKISDLPFQIAELKLDMEEDCFISMKEFNQLRRQAFEELESACRRRNRRDGMLHSDAIPIDELVERQDLDCTPSALQKWEQAPVERKDLNSTLADWPNPDCTKTDSPDLAVYISDQKQLEAVLQSPKISQLGFEVEAFSNQELVEFIDRVRQVFPNCKKMSDSAYSEIETRGVPRSLSIILAMPHIYRMDMKQELLRLLELPVDGYLVRTLDELALIRQDERLREKELILDSSVYAYNRKAAECLRDWMQAGHMTLPVEYSKEELLTLLQTAKEASWDFVIYGRQMVMVTAQCTYLNLGRCRKSERSTDLWIEQSGMNKSGENEINNERNAKQEAIWTDTRTNRKGGSLLLQNSFGDEFLVEPICRYCYNVIYQNVPNCYFEVIQELPQNRLHTLRIHLTTESEAETKELIEQTLPKQYLLGRFRKGIE